MVFHHSRGLQGTPETVNPLPPGASGAISPKPPLLATLTQWTFKQLQSLRRVLSIIRRIPTVRPLLGLLRVQVFLACLGQHGPHGPSMALYHAAECSITSLHDRKSNAGDHCQACSDPLHFIPARSANRGVNCVGLLHIGHAAPAHVTQLRAMLLSSNSSASYNA